MDRGTDHHDHHTLGEIIAGSFVKSEIATADEADAFIACWWEALDQDRREAEAEKSRCY